MFFLLVACDVFVLVVFVLLALPRLSLLFVVGGAWGVFFFFLLVSNV